MWRKEDVINQLRKEQGNQSLRTFARALGCSAAYLSDVYRGNRELGPTLLDHLNLDKQVVKTVTYVKRRSR